MRVNEIFHNIQGEGAHVGQNVIFIRLSGCTLSCKWCDTTYHVNGKEMSIDEIFDIVVNINSHHIVFTGGEPLLQQDEIYKLIQKLGKEYYYSIETNGTVMPKWHMLENINHFACSPKLGNSGNTRAVRYKPEVLERLNDTNKVIFKFVITRNKDLEEIGHIQNNINIPNYDIYLMPEGASFDEQIGHSKKVVEACLAFNYNFSPRLQVLIWDDKRGV